MELENNAPTDALPPVYLRAFAPSVVKAKNPETREILHLITTPATDRVGDVVEPGGADIANFMRNPVVMADHHYSIEKVIGRAMSLAVEKDGIYARTRFRDTPLAQAAYALASEGLGGWSIGFRPHENGWEAIRDDKNEFKGIRYKRWELLEYSSVAIPANQDIVNDAIKRGLVGADLAAAFFIATPPPVSPVPASAAGNVPNARATLALTPPLQRAVRQANARIALIDLTEQLAVTERLLHGR